MNKTVLLILISFFIVLIVIYFFYPVNKSESHYNKSKNISKDFDDIEIILESYKEKHNKYPFSLTDPNIEYTFKNLLDPWGQEYKYIPSNNYQDYKLFTLGKDGKEGGINQSIDYYLNSNLKNK